MTGTQEIMFNGHSLSEHGCVILEPPKRPFPKRKYEKKPVYGRNGDLIIDSETYENIKITYKVATIPGLYGNRFVDEVLTDLKAAFCTSVEYMPLYDTELPDGFYLAFCANISDAVCTFDEMYEFDITFDCKPFFYYTNGQKKLVSTNREFELFNYGTQPSKPLIGIYGVGELTCAINSQSFTVSNMTGNASIDSEKMIIIGNGINFSDNFEGDYPVFHVGENAIAITGGAFGRVEIVPRWCRL